LPLKIEKFLLEIYRFPWDGKRPRQVAKLSTKKRKVVMEHYNVLICTPGHSMDANYVKSLIKTINVLNEEGITYKFLNEYSSQVAMAREATASNSLNLNAFSNLPGGGEFTYDKMFWIDSDIAWTPKDFIDLYKSNKDIISGIYFNNKGLGMIKGVGEEEHPITISNIKHFSKNIFEIESAGFGFICVKSGVFENMQRPWFDTEYFELKDGEKTIRLPYGEDFSWCVKARKSGFKIWADPTIVVDHYKNIRVGI
jgi:hypothetical protein